MLQQLEMPAQTRRAGVSVQGGNHSSISHINQSQQVFHKAQKRASSKLVAWTLFPKERVLVFNENRFCQRQADILSYQIRRISFACVAYAMAPLLHGISETRMVSVVLASVFALKIKH